MMEKVCLTTYVWGDNYQLYIPIAVFSIKKMYPEYDIIIYLHGKLNPSLKRILEELDLCDKVCIKEDTFADCPNINRIKAQSLRWVLNDDQLKSYDYVYVIDIDMFYIKEPIPLHKQHIYHMNNVTGLPFDNMRRVIDCDTSSLMPRIVELGRYIKYFGLRGCLTHFSHFTDIRYKLSGLHFINVSQYFNVLNDGVINKYKEKIYNGSFLSDLPILSDEIFLYSMLKESGFDVDKLAKQDFSPGFKHMNFNDFDKPLFRPTHGIHMGDFRGGGIVDVKKENEVCYNYYREYMINNVIGTPDFCKFLSLLNSTSRTYFKRYFSFAKISLEDFPSIYNILNENN